MIVLLADDEDMFCYGPVLRSLVVGLIDEVAELSVLALGDTWRLDHIPCPPVRIITETKNYCCESSVTVEADTRKVAISSPRLDPREFLWPSRRLNRLAETLAAYKPTLLHAISERQGPLARSLSKKLDIPYVVSLLSQTDTYISVSQARCRGILPCSSWVAGRIRKRYRYLASRTRLLPIGTHVPDEPCCFNDGRPIAQLFCCGPFRQGYGFTELINAARLLRQKGHLFNLTLSGVGPAEHDLRCQARDLGLASQIHFIEPVESLTADNDAYKLVLSATDIFIQPWPERRWYPPLMEAMSVGDAVVAASGVNNDLVLDGKTALTFPFHNEAALVESLGRLLRDQSYARTLASQAQQYLRKHFLASQTVTHLIKAYRHAVGGE